MKIFLRCLRNSQFIPKSFTLFFFLAAFIRTNQGFQSDFFMVIAKNENLFLSSSLHMFLVNDRRDKIIPVTCYFSDSGVKLTIQRHSKLHQLVTCTLTNMRDCPCGIKFIANNFLQVYDFSQAITYIVEGFYIILHKHRNHVVVFPYSCRGLRAEDVTPC